MFKRGCSSKKKIVENHGLEENDYLYAKDTGTKWIKASGKDKKNHKFFVTVEWFDENFAASPAKKLKDNTKPAPPIIELNDHEKFPNDEGGVMEIEVVGKRSVDECYFKVKDVANGFDLPSLHEVIIDKRKKCGHHIHNEYFYCKNPAKGKNNRTKKLFLTYFGVLRVLFTSRGNNLRDFTMWACKILSIAQMGTGVQKIALAGKLLGTDTKYVLDVYSTITYMLRLSFCYWNC